MADRAAVEAAIRAAFAGVRLGTGVSLRQAEAIDVWMEGYTWAQFDALPEAEVTDDWSLIPEDELRQDNVSHLDAEGLRYYLPALMLWLLDHYSDRDDFYSKPAEATVIGTMRALAPYAEFRASRYADFDTFTDQQRAAIAQYLDALPDLVNLDYEDATLVARSVEQYWGRFLDSSRM